jgi:hypothetical protein
MAPYAALSLVRTGVLALRVAVVLCLPRMRERGAWVSALGSACPALRLVMRVLTRPVLAV